MRTNFIRVTALCLVLGFNQLLFAQSFNPSQVSNLVVWLRADTLVTSSAGAVSNWGDISGNGNSAAQATQNKKPTINNPACFNNRQALHFDGTAQVLTGPILTALDNSSATIFVVVHGENTAVTGAKGFFSTGTLGQGLVVYAGGTPNYFYYRNSTGAVVASTAQIPITGYPYTILEAVKTFNTSVALYQNGTQVGTGNAATAGTFTNGAYTIGQSTNYFKGEFAELIVYNKALTTIERQQVEAYINSRYAPDVSLGPDTTVNGFCPVQLSAGCRFVSRLWNTGQTTDTITLSQPGTYWVQATNVFGKVSSDTVQISFPSANLNLSTATLCPGDSVLLFSTVADTTGLTFTWQDGAHDKSRYVTGAGNYTLTITQSGGCNYVTNTATVVVDSFKYTVSLGNDTSLCSGNSIGLITPANQSGLSFLWSTSSTSPTIPINATGDYRVTVTNSNNCLARDTIHVTVNGTAPTVSFTSDTICLGIPYQPVNNTTSIDPIASYNWQFGNGDVSAVATPSYVYPSAGTYTASLTVNTTTGCSGYASKTVQILNSPTALFYASQGCIQTPVQFTDQSLAPSGGSISGWQWSFGDASSSSAQNPTHTYTSGNTYQVQLIVSSSSGCYDTASSSVTIVNSAPAAGQAILLQPADNISTSNTNVQFTWQSSANAISYALQVSTSPTFSNPTIYYTSATQQAVNLGGANQTYYWRVFAFNLCGDSSVSVTQSFSVFSVSNLPGLQLWLAADNGVVDSSGFLHWADISGNNNNCAASSVATSPTVTSNINWLNYKPAIHFDGSNDSLRGALLVGLDTSSASVFVVASGENGAQASAKGFFAAGTLGQGMVIYAGGTPNVLTFRSGTGAVVASTAQIPITGYQFGLLEAVKTLGTSIALYKNSIQVGTGSASTALTFTNAPYTLAKATNMFKGNIAEVLVFNKALTATQRQQVESYIYEKYAPPVNLGPDINLTYSLCPVTLTAENRFVSYLWSTGDTGVSQISARASGTYWVRATDVFGRVSSDTVNVTIPYHGMNVHDTIACAGTPISVAPLLSSSPYQYKWYNNDSSTVISTASSYSTAMQGNYFVLLTDTNGCSFMSDTIAFQVDSFAYQSVVPDTARICGGNQITLNTGNYTAQSISWSNGNTGPSVLITNSVNLGVTVTDINGCIISDLTHVIKTWTAPATNFTASNGCLGDTIYFADATQAVSPDVVSQWNWTLGDGDTSTQNSFGHYYSLTGEYLATLSVTTDSGCTGYAQQFVRVSAYPHAAFTYPGVICAGTTSLFYDQSSIAGGDTISAWTWIFNGTDTAHAQSVQYAFPGQGIIPVTLITETSVGCADTASQTVEVFASFVSDFGFEKVCLGDSTVFTDQSQSFSIISWQWDFGDNSFYNYNQNPKHKYAAPGIYAVTLSAQNAIGCVDTTVKNISVAANPVADFAPTVACQDDYYKPIDNSTSANEAINKWRWNINGSLFTIQAPQQFFADTGNYPVSLKITTVSGCIDSVSKIVSIKPKPEPDFAFNPLYGEAPAQITFTNLSTNAVSYVWHFGEGDPSSDVNPQYTYQNNDTFNIVLEATSQYGCVDSASRTFIVTPTDLDVAVTNVQTTQMALPDGSVQVSISAKLSNVGTRVVTDVKLYATVGTGGVIEETWSGLLYSAQTITYSFTAKFIVSPQNSNSYACVEAKEVNNGETEINTDNNKQCTSLNGTIQLVGPSPNPSSDQSVLGIILPKAGPVYIAIVDALGHYVVNETTVNLPQGRSDYPMPVGQLLAAEYYVRVRYNDDKLVRKFVIRK